MEGIEFTAFAEDMASIVILRVAIQYQDFES